MNLAKGNNSVLIRLAQYPKGNVFFVGIDRPRGMRFGLARRLLGAARGEDILPPELARRLAKKPNAAYRWETGEDRPRVGTVEELAKMCQEAGLPITAGWLERGEAELPAISIPAGALRPRPVERQKKTAGERGREKDVTSKRPSRRKKAQGE